jgi:hypothetical protein
MTATSPVATAAALALLAVALAAPARSAPAADSPAGVERAIAAAARSWDAGAAVAALTRARTLQRAAPSERTTRTLVDADLLAAELLRVRYEGTPAGAVERDTLGARIDAFAGEGLALLPSLPSTSERWRIEADLIATMMRSDFRARKYEARFRAAVAEARRLDPRNPRAIVSAAKPLLFAPPGHGRDLHAGIALLDQALALDPRLVQALLLRAYASDALGERDAAVADWRGALALDPECTPAREGLARAAGRK